MRISDWSSDVCSSDLSSQIREGIADHTEFKIIQTGNPAIDEQELSRIKMSEGRPGPVLRHIAFQPADGEFDQRLRPRFAARVHGIISMKSRKGDLVSSLRKRQSSRYERLKRQAMHRRHGFDILPRNRLPLRIITRG